MARKLRKTLRSILFQIICKKELADVTLLNRRLCNVWKSYVDKTLDTSTLPKELMGATRKA